MPRKAIRKRRPKTQYSKGEINAVIDSLLHPWMIGETRVAAIALDSMLHMMVEQDAVKSLQKFCRYVLPKIIDETFKKMNENK